MSYQIPIDGLHGENKKFALMINGIGTGLNKAVAEAMKTERLKTDLITNVSHDIKTPLTSILNYVGILRQIRSGGSESSGLSEYSGRESTETEDIDRRCSRSIESQQREYFPGIYGSVVIHSDHRFFCSVR